MQTSLARYHPRVVPPSQIIPTSRAAFAISVLGAVVAATWLLGSAMWEEATLAGAISRIGAALIAMMPTAFLGAAAGGMLALLFGARLSRQYCWLFAIIAGLLAIPISAYTWAQHGFALDLRRRVPSTFAGWNIELFIFGAPPIGGIVLAVWTTTRRIGFAARARRAAWLGLIIGVACYVVVELVCQFAMRSRNIIVTTVGAPSEAWRYLTLGGFWALVAASIGALCFADHPREVRYEVLPASSLAEQH
jgi:hypothetical protein